MPYIWALQKALRRCKIAKPLSLFQSGSGCSGSLPPRAPAAATRSRWLTLGVTKKRGLPRFVSAKYSLIRLRIYYTIRKYAIASFTELFFRNFQKNSILINFSLCKRLFCLARRALYIFFFLFFFFIFVFFFLFIFYFLEEKEKGGVGEKEKTFFAHKNICSAHCRNSLLRSRRLLPQRGGVRRFSSFPFHAVAYLTFAAFLSGPLRSVSCGRK